jgi:hypothetical protein
MAVELFVFGALLVWMIVSGKLKAVVSAAFN